MTLYVAIYQVLVDYRVFRFDGNIREPVGYPDSCSGVAILRPFA